MVKIILKNNQPKVFQSIENLMEFTGIKDKDDLLKHPLKYGIKQITIEENNRNEDGKQMDNNIILETLEKGFIVKSELIKQYKQMIEEMEDLHNQGIIKDIGFIVPLLDIDGISIAVMREILINTFDIRVKPIPITKKYIQMRWEGNGKNKIISNIPQKECKETYWVSFDIDFPFEVFGLKGKSYHNHYSLMNYNNPHSFNPNDVLFKDNIPTKDKTNKRWKLGTSPLLLAFEGLFKQEEWKIHLLSMGDSSNKNIGMKGENIYQLGIYPSQQDVETPIKYLGGMEFMYPKNEVFMFNGNVLVFNPMYNLNYDLQQYMINHFPFGEKFMEWDLNGELLILRKQEDFNTSTDILMCDTYCFLYYDKDEQREVFTHFVNVLRG